MANWLSIWLLGDGDVLGHLVIELLGGDVVHLFLLHLLQRRAVVGKVVLDGGDRLGLRVLDGFVCGVGLHQLRKLLVIPVLHALLSGGLLLVRDLAKAQLLDLLLDDQVLHHHVDVLLLEVRELVGDLGAVLGVAVLGEEGVEPLVKGGLGDGVFAHGRHRDLFGVDAHQRAARQRCGSQRDGQQLDELLHFRFSSFLAKTLLLLMHPSIIQDNGTGCKYYSVTFL